MSILSSILNKWLLVGKRKPGSFPQTFVTEMADWAADWHFRVATELFFSFTAYSKVWNVILFLSFFSCHSFPAWNGCRPEVHFSADNFPPSKVDLIKVIELFLCSTASFVTKTENEHHKITIDQNSVRYNAHFLDQELAAYLVSLYQLLLCLIQTNASTQK